MAQSIIGQSYGRLTVLQQIPQEKGNKRGRVFRCRCDCGGDAEIPYGDLNNGKTLSCGCLKAEHLARHRPVNPRTRHPLYPTWQGMISRCYRPSQSNYKYYGARGIAVCSSWRNDFWQFVKDMGAKPGDNYQIDRIDPDGDYCPENCRWITGRQNKQRRRDIPGKVTMQYVVIDGNEMRLKDACDAYGVRYSLAYSRIVAHNRPVSDVFPVDGEMIEYQI